MKLPITSQRLKITGADDDTWKCKMEKRCRNEGKKRGDVVSFFVRRQVKREREIEKQPGLDL
jgi:hypothetical protein